MAYNNLTSKTEAVNIILGEYFLIKPPKFTPGVLKKTDNKHPEVINDEEVIERGSHIPDEQEDIQQ